MYVVNRAWRKDRSTFTLSFSDSFPGLFPQSPLSNIQDGLSRTKGPGVKQEQKRNFYNSLTSDEREKNAKNDAKRDNLSFEDVLKEDQIVFGFGGKTNFDSVLSFHFVESDLWILFAALKDEKKNEKAEPWMLDAVLQTMG